MLACENLTFAKRCNNLNNIFIIPLPLLFPQPTTLQLGDASAGPEGVQQVRTLKSLPAQFNAVGLVEQQFQATSEDGTKVNFVVSVYFFDYVNFCSTFFCGENVPLVSAP